MNIMKHVIRESQVKMLKFSKVMVKEMLNSDKPSVSIAKIILSGKNEKNKNTTSQRIQHIKTTGT